MQAATSARAAADSGSAAAAQLAAERAAAQAAAERGAAEVARLRGELAQLQRLMQEESTVRLGAPGADISDAQVSAWYKT